MHDPFPQAAWIERLEHEVSRQRNVLLHGQIDDEVPCEHRPAEDGDHWLCHTVPFSQVVTERLRDLGYSLVVEFDLAAGLSARTGSDRVAVQKLSPRVRPLWAASAPAPSEPGGPARTTDRDSTVVAAPSGTSDVAGAGAALDEALAATLELVTQTSESFALVLGSADLALQTETSLGDDQRRRLTYLRRIVSQVSLAPGHSGEMRNIVVLTAKELAPFPGWLHRANPHVAAIAVQPPTTEQRQVVLKTYGQEFYGSTTLTAEERLSALDRLANLTQGMSVLELRSLIPTSQVTRTPIDEGKRLVTQYRTGLRRSPWERVDRSKVEHSRSVLSARVIGQDPVVQRVYDMLVNARVGIDFTPPGEDATRPKGVFFFVGPTGVGKTELAKAIAHLVFDDEKALIRFDMSEFRQDHAGERLTGSPPGYVGHSNGGALTNWVMERPFSVILFDEIEKANPRIFDTFLQILDDGRLTDGQGRTAYFSETVVIFTSNLGSQTLWELSDGQREQMEYPEVAQLFRDAVKAEIGVKLGRPELLGRLGRSIVPFDILRRESVRTIARKFLDQLTASAAGQGVQLVLDEAAILSAVCDQVLADGARLGARPIRDPLLEELVRIPLTTWLFENKVEAGARIAVEFAGAQRPCRIRQLA